MNRLLVAMVGAGLLLGTVGASVWLLTSRSVPPPSPELPVAPAPEPAPTPPPPSVQSQLEVLPLNCYIRVECGRTVHPGPAGSKPYTEAAGSARVRVTRLSDQFSFETLADKDGRVHLWVPPGRYEVWLQEMTGDKVEVSPSPDQINTVKLHATWLLS